jgi:RNA polymerase sigma-70 factor (ECF subfamily)
MSASMATKDSTAVLVRRAQGGDREAFDHIVKRFGSRLESQIRSRMGSRVRSQVESEDILNETFGCAFESINRLEWLGEETFYRWLASIAEHLIRNASRKKTWEHLRVDRVTPGTDASPSRALRRNDRFERLAAALEKLRPDYKNALVLSRIKGLTVEEIAERMNRSKDAVKKLLARGLRELKRSFGDTESLHLPDRELPVEGPADDE